MEATELNATKARITGLTAGERQLILDAANEFRWVILFGRATVQINNQGDDWVEVSGNAETICWLAVTCGYADAAVLTADPAPLSLEQRVTRLENKMEERDHDDTRQD